MNQALPVDFLESIPLPIDEKAALIKSIGEAPPVSIRLNRKKADLIHALTAVPWHTDGYYLPERPRFTSDPAFHAGAYYPQEASSMFLSFVIHQLGLEKEPITALDLCAAPGGKSTLLRSALNESSLLLANEVVGSRVNLLEENLTKWGVPGFSITQSDPFNFGKAAEMFDLVVVDAPCSGEGLFRKDPAAQGEWSLQNVNMCASRQQKILNDVWPSLKAGGILIYSTCTFNTLENEENVAWLLAQQVAESVVLSSLPEGVESVTYRGAESYRFFPHKLRGEGFFCSVFRKGGKPRTTKTERPFFKLLEGIFTHKNLAAIANEKGDVFAVRPEHIPTIGKLEKLLNMRHHGLPVGKWTRETFKASHGYSMLCDTEYNMPSLDVNIEQALAYLKREDVQDIQAVSGTHLIKFEGFTLGLGRYDGHRLLSLYPMDWRIRNANSAAYSPIVKAI